MINLFRIEDYDKAAELNKTNAGIYFRRGNAKHKLMDNQGACIDWHTALSYGHKTAQMMISQHCK
jgi:hypothetical protein